MKCSVAGCGLCQSKNRPNLTFHRLPRNECRRREWLENIGLENIRPGTRDIHVCSLHFEESAFNKTLNIIRLRDDAIPTVFAKADQVLNSGGGEGAAALPAPPGQYTQIDDQTKPVPPSEVPKPEEVKVPENQDQLNKETPGPEQNPAEVKPAETQAGATVNDATPQQQDWHQKEAELLKKITELETVKKERTEESLKFELKVREDEIDLLKARVKNLETELQAALSKPSGKNHEMIENIKQQHEELLSKARGMIFDKTKMVKNQELQIEALTTQVASLKDINQITKDLLEIRNSEVKAMEERYQAMDARYKAEKERHSLVLQRAQNSSNINEDLRKEYETQLAIFKELRSKYEERVKGLALENERLKSSLAPNDSGPSK